MIRRLVACLFGALALAAVLAPAAGGYVYWANLSNGLGPYGGTTIGRLDNSGGNGAGNSFVAGAHHPCGVAVNGTHIFWTNSGSGTIGRANLDGTGVTQTFITTGGNPCGVAVGGGYVFWAGGGGGNAVGRAELDGSNPVASFIATGSGACGVGVSGDHVYWATDGGSIGRAEIDGDPVTQNLITGATNPCGVAMNSTHIYWGNGNNAVGRANLDGTGANQTFLAGLPSYVCMVALDASSLYYAIGGGGNRIGRAGLDGSGANNDFITGAVAPCGVAVDALPLPAPADGDGDGVADSSDACPAVAGPVANNGCPSVPGRPTTTSMVCNPIGAGAGVWGCVATVADTGEGTPTAPTGDVVLQSGEGSFPEGDTCTLVADPSAPLQATCGLQFQPPASGEIAITANYVGDSSHGTSNTGFVTSAPRTVLICGSGILPSCPPGFTPPVVCVSLWIGDCEGRFPKPSPVKVCVALWQDCTGFGGSKPAAPGTIDLAGFPATVTTPVSCPRTTTRDRPGLPTATAAVGPTAGQGYRPNMCQLGVEISTDAFDGTPPLALKELREAYERAGKSFRARVFSERDFAVAAQLAGIRELTGLFDNKDLGVELFNRIKQATATRIADAAVLGRPIDTLLAGLLVTQCPSPLATLPPGWSARDRTQCNGIALMWSSFMVEKLTNLQAEKAQRGVDKPFKPPSQRRRGIGQSSAKKSRYTIALLAGDVTLKRARSGKLTLRMPKAARKFLRAKRKAGARRITGTAITRTTLIHGLRPMTRKTKIRIILKGKR